MHGLVECRCSRARGADVTIRDVTIKTPDWKWNRGREWRHTWKRWEFWGFEKKQLVGIQTWARPDDFGAARWLGEWRCKSSQRRKNQFEFEVSLEWTNFVFSDSYMLMNIMNILWTYVYFSFSYLGRIFGRGPMLHKISINFCRSRP